MIDDGSLLINVPGADTGVVVTRTAAVVKRSCATTTTVPAVTRQHRTDASSTPRPSATIASQDDGPASPAGDPEATTPTPGADDDLAEHHLHRTRTQGQDKARGRQGSDRGRPRRRPTPTSTPTTGSTEHPTAPRPRLPSGRPRRRAIPDSPRRADPDVAHHPARRPSRTPTRSPPRSRTRCQRSSWSSTRDARSTPSPCRRSARPPLTKVGGATRKAIVTVPPGQHRFIVTAIRLGSTSATSDRTQQRHHRRRSPDAPTGLDGRGHGQRQRRPPARSRVAWAAPDGNGSPVTGYTRRDQTAYGQRTRQVTRHQGRLRGPVRRHTDCNVGAVTVRCASPHARRHRDRGRPRPPRLHRPDGAAAAARGRRRSWSRRQSTRGRPGDEGFGTTTLSLSPPADWAAFAGTCSWTHTGNRGGPESGTLPCGAGSVDVAIDNGIIASSDGGGTATVPTRSSSPPRAGPAPRRARRFDWATYAAHDLRDLPDPVSRVPARADPAHPTAPARSTRDRHRGPDRHPTPRPARARRARPTSRRSASSTSASATRSSRPCTASGRSSTWCWSRSSPAATCCSRTCPAPARRRWPARSARALGGEQRRVQFTPDLLPSDVTGTTRLRPARRPGPLPPGPGLRPRRARRRDQPGRRQDPVGAAGGDGGAHRHRRRRDPPRARPVPRHRHPEPRRPRRHLPAARGPARPVPGPRRPRLPRRRARDRGAAPRQHRRPASTTSRQVTTPTEVAAIGAAAGDAARRRPDPALRPRRSASRSARTRASGSAPAPAGCARWCAACRSTPRLAGPPLRRPRRRPAAGRAGAGAPHGADPRRRAGRPHAGRPSSTRRWRRCRRRSPTWPDAP